MNSNSSHLRTDEIFSNNCKVEKFPRELGQQTTQQQRQTKQKQQGKTA